MGENCGGKRGGMSRIFVTFWALFVCAFFISIACGQAGETLIDSGTAGAVQETPEQHDAGRVEVGGESHRMEPLVVTATRVETPLSQVTKSVSVVSAEDRDAQQKYFLPDLLDAEPGVYLRRSGGPGQLSTISIRGAGSQHTQFQYNGFPLRDAADTQSTLQYFIGDLFSGSNLRQVEILRGTQSTLYGSQAMGGVINIVPEKWKQGFGGELRTEAGAYNTYQINGRLQYGEDRFFLDVNPLYVTTKGQTNGGPDGYYYNNLGYTAGAGFRITPDMNIEYSSLFYDSELALSRILPSLDANGNLVKNLADPVKRRESRLSQNGLTFNHSVSTVWDYSLKGAYGQTERDYIWSATLGDLSYYDGSTTYLETQHNLNVTEWLSFLLGADYEVAKYDGKEPRNPWLGDYSSVFFKEEWWSWDLFAQARLKFLDESLVLALGGRYNDHEKFDSKLVGEASAAYIFKQTGTKIHGTVGTGYRTPSLYEVYGGYLWNGQLITIGNPDLQPEESIGYEIGVEQRLLDDAVIAGITGFYTEFDDLIIFDGFLNKYNNATKARTRGFETYANVKPWEWLQLDVAYTYVDAEYRAQQTGEWTRKEYLPRNKVSGTATVRFPEGLTTSVRAIWQGEKIVPLYDPTWTRVRWEEPSVVTVDAAVSYSFLKHYEAWIRVENLFDEDYSEGGYTMPGRWIYGGLKVSF